MRRVLVTMMTELSSQLLELSLIQARVRLEAIVLVPIELDAADALEIASANRLDWMNARSSLVDTWRLIQFNANNLLSDLDVVFNGDIGTTADNPFGFNHSTGRLQVGLEWDAPLTRVAERNNYRQSLIEYASARRNYVRYVDQVNQGLRATLRTIELNQMNFELRRAAVRVAISQVELARLRLSEPPKPGDAGPTSTTTARDLVDALSGLNNDQDAFLSVWVNYEVLRRSLDFNLGTMLLDNRGVWVDPGPIRVPRSGPREPREEIPPGEIGVPVYPEPEPLPIPEANVPEGAVG
ncbi:MAG: TolC family protein [Pirellulales bacterium]